MKMKKILKIFVVILLGSTDMVFAQSVALEDILEDIYNQLYGEDILASQEDGVLNLNEESEYREELFENIQEELLDIAAHPINLNQTTADELSRLRFLSNEQIDAILLYQYEHPFQEIYELQLIDCLKDYEIRNLLPFVYVGNVDANTKKMYAREVFHYAKHEMTLRMDARNIEDFNRDPIYGKLRYRLNYQNRVQAGLTISRTAGSPLKDIDLGGYIELREIGSIKTIVAGYYQANFGYGLVVGSPFKGGKNAYLQSTTIADEGLKKFGSAGNDYNDFRGLGATAKIGKRTEVSTFYSLRRSQEKEWNHVVGANATGRWKRLKLGVTLVENISDNYNQQSVIGQTLMGANARYNNGKIDLWGEVALSQGNPWGFASIAGMRYTPASDVNLLVIYRYYSKNYDNPYANTLCSWTRIKNEHGGYLGVEYNRLKNWQLSAFGDIWKSGFETMVQADFLSPEDYRMHTRFRAKRNEKTNTYSLRWNMVYKVGQWKMKTQADGNLVKANGIVTYGWSLLQDVEYRFAKVPIVLQMRAQLFDAQEWNNHIYIYENDVLYAYAIPFVYGKALRCWLNARYKVNDTFSVYLRASETLYQRAWAEANNRKKNRTDVHVLLRMKL